MALDHPHAATRRPFARLILLSCLCVSGMTGCSWLKEWPPREGPVRHNQAAAPTVPQTRLMQTADATWLVPPSKAETPVTRMVPAHGEEASTINRVRELEAEIAQLRNEMGMMVPAVTKLAETQSAMRDTLTAAVAPSIAPSGGDAAFIPSSAVTASGSSPMPLLPAAPHPAISPAAQPAAQAASSAAIAAIRFGDEKGRTRIVLDAATAPSYSYDIDNGEQIMIIRLPQSAWRAATTQSLAGSPLVAAYNATPDGAGGTILAVQLRRPAQVTMAQTLAPGAGKGHRLVIDLAPL